MKFKDAVELANKIGVEKESLLAGGLVVLDLMNGDQLIFSSIYEHDYSPDTPGDGICPPTVRHNKCVCREFAKRIYIGNAMWACAVHGRVEKNKEI